MCLDTNFKQMKKLFIVSLLLTVLFGGCSKDSGKNEDGPEEETSEDAWKNIDFSQPIRGVNWADERDNFVDDVLVLSGLTSGDGYYMVQTDAQLVIKGFIENMSANTVRLPVNYSTVNSTWWNGYKGAIDKAIEKGMRVILAYWESESFKDGKVDNNSEFWTMWSKIIADYGQNKGVYFEVINEPYGYSLTELTDIYAKWLENYPDIPHERVLLGGKGYSEDVTGVGADSRFSNCLLSLHNYAFWANRTAEEWRTDWLSRIGDYASRTVVTEFGSTMTQGKDYSTLEEGDNEIDYIQASTSVFKENNIQSIYWPGLRNGDWYSIQTLNKSIFKMYTSNESGLYWIQYGWGLNP